MPKIFSCGWLGYKKSLPMPYYTSRFCIDNPLWGLNCQLSIINCPLSIVNYPSTYGSVGSGSSDCD